MLAGCSKDDDEISEPGDTFYKDAFTSATKEQLSGLWSIYEVAFEGKTASIPVSYQECGRDFFQFTTNNTYREFIYTSSYECEKEILDLTYDLEKGIISLSNDWGPADEMVITQLNADKLVFKMKMEIDEDPEPEVLSFIARRYAPPNDLDLYSYTFGYELNEDNRNEIKFTWLAYEGFYKFNRYEIYRSDSGCTKANAKLVASITNSSQTSFIDKDPPVSEDICYYFKVFNEKGLLGESQMINFFTQELRPAQVEFINVEVLAGDVKLEWQPFEGNYFSHYKITVRNYKGGTGPAYQEYPVAIVKDREVTSIVDENPPRLTDPVYAIYVYDIFGNVSLEPYSEKNAWELSRTHPEVLNFEMIKFVTPDPNASEVFFYGRQANGENNLVKYNYGEKIISAIANKQPQTGTGVQMQVHTGETGKELFFAQGNALAVYDANDLAYKYQLVPPSLPIFFDFAYLGNNIFSFTDSETIYTYKRNNTGLEFISKKAHFTANYGNTDYHLIPLKNGEILVGHYQEAKSYKFSINAMGELSEGELVNIPITSRGQKKTFYSPNKDYVINLDENKIYSTLTWNWQESFESPYFPSGISRNGNLILGSNNDPGENITSEAIHEKKARIYNLTTKNVTTVETKGYPHLLFENHQGQIISISSGFKRASLDNFAPKQDLFVEIVQF